MHGVNQSMQKHCLRTVWSVVLMPSYCLLVSDTVTASIHGQTDDRTTANLVKTEDTVKGSSSGLMVLSM